MGTFEDAPCTIRRVIHSHMTDSDRVVEEHYDPIKTPLAYPIYITFRRKLLLLGMEMMVLSAIQEGVHVSTYQGVSPGNVNPRLCDRLTYEFLGDYHVRITTKFQDVGEIDIL